LTRTGTIGIEAIYQPIAVIVYTVVTIFHHGLGGNEGGQAKKKKKKKGSLGGKYCFGVCFQCHKMLFCFGRTPQRNERYFLPQAGAINSALALLQPMLNVVTHEYQYLVTIGCKPQKLERESFGEGINGWWGIFHYALPAEKTS